LTFSKINLFLEKLIVSGVENLKNIQLLDKPLPKPWENPEMYAQIRVLEAILESRLAIEFLEKGYTRNAAGKVFQAWKALLASLLVLERDKILQKLTKIEDRKWFEKIILRIPSSKLKIISQLLEDIDYSGITHKTATALDLHDYQYHGPDPTGEVSKYPNRESAAKDIMLMIYEILEFLRKYVKNKLGKLWIDEFDKEIENLYKSLHKSV